MAELLRGEIYWAELDPVRGHEQGGRRPVLILSHDIFNDRSGTVIVLAITSQPQRAGYPLTWQVPAGILPRDSWVKISQIRTLSSERLRDPIGRVAARDLDSIVQGLLQLIG
ncbi:MAG TPA: type II toxin-antitoxin system PemK/MazF family toxin [Dehalococcoidia bacterium]|nr:type II toxin-antitoxin system PemK/MazF family toxin [Dehalococcoidia bacterium]